MKHRNDAIVGLTVIGIIFATITAVMWVKQANIGQREHDVVAHFRDVGNARVGNSVVIRGVVGGRLQAIELAKGGWVDVTMRLNPDVQLPSDPVVLLNESSLFGDWQATVVERQSMPKDDELRRAIDEASHDPGTLPGASLPGIGKLTAVAGQIAGNVANVASRVQTAFDDSAARELRASIRNVARLTGTLRSIAQEHESDLDTLSQQLQGAVTTLHRTTHIVETTAGRIDSAATSAEVRDLVANMSAASGDVRQAAIQLRTVSARLATTQARADAFLATSDSVLAKINHGQGTLGLLVNDPSVYQRTDSMLAEVRGLLADIRANPRKYIAVRLF